jgi:hypothetical protein
VGADALREVQVSRVTSGGKEVNFGGYGAKATISPGMSWTIHLWQDGLARTAPTTVKVACQWVEQGVRREHVFSL